MFGVRIAFVCNRQKLAAKLAGEQSSLLFLALYLKDPVQCSAAVLDVKDRSFDVIVRDYGTTLRVYTDVSYTQLLLLRKLLIRLKT